jgi:hypothetical protein
MRYLGDEKPPYTLAAQPAAVERGSAVLQWTVVVLLLAFVGAVLVTPSMAGKHVDAPAYVSD